MFEEQAQELAVRRLAGLGEQAQQLYHDMAEALGVDFDKVSWWAQAEMASLADRIAWDLGLADTPVKASKLVLVR